LLDRPGGSIERAQISVTEADEQVGQRADAAVAPGFQEASALGGCVHAHDTP